MSLIEVIMIYTFEYVSIIHGKILWPRQESNLDLELRKLLYYPLYYEAIERRLFQVAIPSVILSGIGLFTEILNIGTKNLYRNGEQYYAEKFS